MKIERPEPLPEVVPYYDYELSVYPDHIRVSFPGGHTEVYDKRVNLPHPLVAENIEIMAKTQKNIKQGYVNRPERRWRK